MKIFFLVLARDEKHVSEKIEELRALGMPYLIVCGKNLNRPNIFYRKPMGKYDAINYGFQFVPEDTDIVALNDVDTRIRNLDSALQLFGSKNVGLVFVKVCVEEGPQQLFYGFLDSIRRRLLVTASGELMLVRRNVLKEIVPIKPCKAEDTYLLLKVLEAKFKCVFCEECWVETRRTKTAEKEVAYKRKTVTGLYQAISYTHGPSLVRLFYILLPFMSPLLLVLGKRGYFWMQGILLGLTDFLRGD